MAYCDKFCLLKRAYMFTLTTTNSTINGVGLPHIPLCKCNVQLFVIVAKNTAVTTATTIPNRQHVKRLTMKVRQSFFDFVQNFLNSAKAESRFRHLQRQTLCNLSKILQLKKGCDHRKEKVIV